MDRALRLSEKDEIEAVLRRNPRLHAYELGDLDDFFWPHTRWFASAPDGDEIVLIYSATELPVLLALADEPHERMRALLHSLAPILPPRFYAHLSGELAGVFARTHRVEPHGAHVRMVLADEARLGQIDTAGVEKLASSDLKELRDLYAASYSGNWFDPRMLETGHYCGIRQHGAIVSVAGVHVYSARYRVAALGNITTHPRYRGRGFGTATTAALCRDLSESTDLIALNVKEDNLAAIRCYEQLGFDRLAVYGEYMITR
jgi:ribosomal protein S18 acetylase RimI-like enzyme